jgi:hypothetical protein
MIRCGLIHNDRVPQESASFSCRVACTLKMEADGLSETSVNINTISHRARIFRFSTVRTFDPKYLWP